MSFLQMTQKESCLDQQIFLAAGALWGSNLGPLAQEGIALTTRLPRVWLVRKTVRETSKTEIILSMPLIAFLS